MNLNVSLPDNLQLTRLDFGYIEAYTHSGPYSCWMQVDNRMYRGNGNSLQEAFDVMKKTFDNNSPIFEQKKQLAKQDIKDIF
jgi:hypothetical protein